LVSAPAKFKGFDEGIPVFQAETIPRLVQQP
jgi:hypothetical protein